GPCSSTAPWPTGNSPTRSSNRASATPSPSWTPCNSADSVRPVETRSGAGDPTITPFRIPMPALRSSSMSRACRSPRATDLPAAGSDALGRRGGRVLAVVVVWMILFGLGGGTRRDLAVVGARRRCLRGVVLGLDGVELSWGGAQDPL